MKTYYDILGISESSEPHQVERAYRDLKETFGVDSLATYSLISPQERTSMLQEIEEAHDILTDLDKRRAYDDFLISKNPLLYKPMSFYRPTLKKVESRSEITIPPQAAPVEPVTPAVTTMLHDQAELTVPVEPVSEPPSSVEAIIASTTFFDGGALQRIRTARGLSIKDVSTHIKISPTQVRRLEEGELAGLPSLIYIKGFLRVYARLLRIDPDRVVQDYLASVRNSLSA